MAKNSRYFDALAVELAGGATIRAAAVAVGCCESTAYRIVGDPAMARRVAELRTDACDQAVGRLSALASSAVDTLASVMRDVEAKPADRIAAAKSVLTMLAPLAELHELRRRLDTIETQQGLRVVGGDA